MQITAKGRKNTIHFDGVHTPFFELKEKGWVDKRLPSYVKKNEGLPPFIINYGAADRGEELEKKLENPVTFNGGRCSVVLGTYIYKDGKSQVLHIPVVGVSTGMGEGSAEIISLETLAHVCLNDIYKKADENAVKEVLSSVSKNASYYFEGNELFTGGRTIMIRAGTAGGCNAFDLRSSNGKLLSPPANRPDMVIAKNNFSTGGTIMESMGYPPSILGAPKNNRLRRKFAAEWEKDYSGSIVEMGDWKFLKNPNSRKVNGALAASAKESGLIFHYANSLSKHSLRFEQSAPQVFQQLRREHGVFGSEMEQAVLAYEAARLGVEKKAEVFTSMITVLVGSLPGTGYPETKEHEKEVAVAIGQGLDIVLASIGKIVSQWQK